MPRARRLQARGAKHREENLPCARHCALMLLALCTAPGAFAAEGPPQGESSLLVWIILLLPAIIFLVIIRFVLRAARRRQDEQLAMVKHEMERSEEARGRTAEFRKRMETRMDTLDEKLSRMIDLLGAIERNQRPRGS